MLEVRLHQHWQIPSQGLYLNAGTDLASVKMILLYSGVVKGKLLVLGLDISILLALLTLSEIINLAAKRYISEHYVFSPPIFLDLLKFIRLMPSTPWCSGVRIRLQPRPGSMPSTPVSMSSSPG